MLNIPFVAWVRKVEEVTDKSIKVERLMEEGYDVVEMPLPGLITVVKEINEPRIAGLKGKGRAKNAEIKKLDTTNMTVDPERIGLKGSPTQVFRSFVPERKSGGEKISGEAAELAQKAASVIQNLGVAK